MVVDDDAATRPAGRVRNEAGFVDHALRLAARIGEVLDEGRAPLVIGGDCGILIGAGVVCLVGAIDDVRELDALTKLGGQLVAAAIIAFAGVQFFSLPLGVVTVLPAPLLVLMTIFIVVLCINAVNFIDGLDGLAAGLVAIAAIAFFIYSYLISASYAPPNVFSGATFVSAALAGACLGFLPHNVFPAKLFMGDSGALTLGLLLAAAAILNVGQIDPAQVSQLGANQVAATVLPLLIPISIMLLPLLDVVWAVARRTARGGWDLVCVRHGRLAGSSHSPVGADPMPYVAALRASAEVVAPPTGPVPAALPEETEKILRWLETPGTRLVSTPAALDGLRRTASATLAAR